MQKMKTRHPRSSTEDEMMSLGSSSSSSSSSSNLSPLALPFTVDRSNPNKPNLNQTLDSQFWPNFHSPSPTTSATTQPPPPPPQQPHGLLADSIRTATVPYASKTLTLNWSSINSTVKSGLEPINQPPANLSVTNPNPRVIDESFYSITKPSNTPATHNWSSMNSNVNSGLESVNSPTSHLFGVNPNSQPVTWSFNNNESVDNAPAFDLYHDYGGAHVNESQSLFGSKYSDGSRGKEDLVFRDRVVGKPRTPVSTTNHGLFSNGFSNEHNSSYIPFHTISPSMPKSSPSVVIKPPVTSSVSAQGVFSTKSVEISGTSVSNKNNVLVNSNLFKEKESHSPAGFEFKAVSKFQVPDIKSSDDVKSSANSSENLDHHNPGEDSPCWKGASTHFSLSGSQEPESSHHPIKKLQKNGVEDNLLPEMIIGSFDGIMDNGFVENAVNNVKAESLNVNVVVKALSNLSELLVLHCSKNECGLKEQDIKALNQVIANLNICMSREIQQVASAQKYTPPQILTSNVLPEAGHLSTLQHEKNEDHFGKNMEDLLNASLKNDDRSKDYDMIQKIQRVLDENIECKEELPSHTLLYKKLWLEAEAEICTSNFKSRFYRVKNEMSKSKESVPDVSEVAIGVKNVSSSNFSAIAPNLHEAAASKIFNTHDDNSSSANVNYHINDVDSSVIARFNILKHRGESNPLNMADKEPADVEASSNEIQSSGVADESHLQDHLGKVHEADSHGNQKMQSSPAMRTNDVEHLVISRWNVLKRKDFAEAEVSNKESQSGDIAIRPLFQHQSVRDNEMPPGSAYMMPHQYGFGSYYNASADWEHVLKDEFS